MLTMQLPVPGQELIEALGRMVLQAGEYVGQPAERIDVVELGGLDQGVDGRGAPTAFVRTGEGPVAPPDGDAAQGAFGGVVCSCRAGRRRGSGRARPSR